MVNAITVGTSANLFFGYQPAWNPNGSETSPFFSPSTSPLAAQTPSTTPTNFQFWASTPVITLHTSPQSLLSAIYDYDVLPVSYDPQNIDVPSGPLSLDDADHEQALSLAGDLIGLNLGKAGNYMLVTYERRTSVTSGDYSGDGGGQSRLDYYGRYPVCSRDFTF